MIADDDVLFISMVLATDQDDHEMMMSTHHNCT